MLKSIIWADKPPVREALMPNFFNDLNLDQVVYKINSLRKHYDIKKLYYMMADSRETLAYRRSVYSELKRPEAYKVLCDFSDKMKQARDFLAYSEEVDFKPQKNVLLVSAAYFYCDAVELFAGLKSDAENSGFYETVRLAGEYAASADYRKFSEKTRKLYGEISGLFYRISLKRDRFSVKEEKSGKNYFDKIQRAFPHACDTGFESPFLHRKTLSHLETEAYTVLADKHQSLIKDCEEFALAYKDFLSEDFANLEYELQLYISFNIFENYMEENGFCFCTPREAGNENPMFRAEGVYDVALALTLFNKERPVVDNEVRYNGNECFMVVTGPNQGGKTTYARSVGQLVYFAMMGLDVAAKMAELPYFDGIMTHFSVEESTETGQGKLKEELTRLAPMMKNNDKNYFIILNELFTTAATYDAAVMGRRVMDHFIGNGCLGIYVTHIKELANVPKAVSLVAVCDEADYHKRLYKMVRKPADGFGYAEAIVEKYELTYEQLIRRLRDAGLAEEAEGEK